MYHVGTVPPDLAVFQDLAYVLVAAALGAAAAWLTRQPLILGYVAGGILIGPFTPGPTVADFHSFEVVAEIGVVLLMFSVGIEFSLSDLLRVKWVALAGGPLGIALSTGLGLVAAVVLGWPLLQGAVIGIVVSVASTMVLARLLMDRGELHTRHGRVTVGITLVEDLAVVVLTVVLPTLGDLGPGRLLAVGTALGKSLVILAPFAYLAWRVVPGILLRVARTRNDELFLMVALAIGLGTAALTHAVGLSLALGAFLAGLVISNSDYAHETLARLLPMRDVFVAVFFVTIGALIDPASVLANLPLLAAIIVLVVAGKLAIWAGVIRLFGYSTATAVLAAVGLTQIGEFSFVLVQVARGAGHVGDDVYNATLAASLITILINATLVRLAPRWVGTRVAETAAAASDGPRRVLLCGVGRIGSAVAAALDTFAVRYTVVERDPDVVRAVRARGLSCIFGDAGQPAVLHAAGVDQAALVVVAIPDAQAAQAAVRAVRATNREARIVARAHARGVAEALREHGATAVVQPELEAATTVIRHALAALAMPEAAALSYVERFRQAMDAGGAVAATGGSLPEITDVTLASGRLTGRSLRDARLRERFGVTVVAIRRAGGDLISNPAPDTVLRAGDRLRVFGLPAQVRALRDMEVDAA
ncbi:MAG TPA: cation:proton antiporter [Candidatus Binatia bacterium]|nr:cation:proton antiporter [Candidatus Binatia bacterium]